MGDGKEGERQPLLNNDNVNYSSSEVAAGECLGFPMTTRAVPLCLFVYDCLWCPSSCGITRCCDWFRFLGGWVGSWVWELDAGCPGMERYLGKLARWFLIGMWEWELACGFSSLYYALMRFTMDKCERSLLSVVGRKSLAPAILRTRDS